MSCPDWNKLKKEYITSRISLRALASKYGLGASKVKAKAASEKWKDKRDQLRAKTDQKTIDKTAEIASEAKKLLYETAMEMIVRLNALAKDSEFDSDLKPRDVTGAMKDCRDILDLKSDIDLEEQKARIEKLRREAAQNEQKAEEIKVRFANAEEEEWAN